jgi:hypothetical protein
MANKVLKGGSSDFQRLGRIGALEHMSWAKIPTYYYDFRRFNLPLTPAEVTNEFGRNIPVFNQTPGIFDGTRQSNTAGGSGVNEAFVALGAGVIAMGEGEGFAIHGVSVAAPEELADTPPIPASTANLGGECYCGSADISGISDDTTRLATFWWGAPTWRFIEKFFQAYRLQVIINARFQIVDESLFDVGMTPVPPEFVGASDSRIPTMPFINATNQVMADKKIDQRFLPTNLIIGEDEASVCLPPPLAEVTYGHPRIIGLANRIYCFNQPILFIPGMRFEVEFFNVDDVSVFTALRNSIQVNCTTAGPEFGENLDDGPVKCGINCTIPGGSVALGVVFKGFALWPQAAVEYLGHYLIPGSMQAAMYSESSQYLGGLLTNPDIDQKLRGHVAGVLGMPGRGTAVPNGDE